jgi:hypothetical protein
MRRRPTTLVAPPIGTEISGQLSSPNHKCLKGREVRVDIEPFFDSATPRQHPTAKTKASGAWHASATLQDRYVVTVNVVGKTIDFKRHRSCGGTQARQSVGDAEPPGTTLSARP